MRTLFAVTAIFLLSVALFFGWQKLSKDSTLTERTVSLGERKPGSVNTEDIEESNVKTSLDSTILDRKPANVSEPEVGDELKEINNVMFGQEDDEQIVGDGEKTELQKKVDRIVAGERRKFFGDLVRELRDKLDVHEMGIVLLEIREIMEQNANTRQRIRKMLDEIMALHENPKDDFFEKVAEYRRERIEFFKTLSLQLRASLQERNLPQDEISLVINSLEKRLEKQRIIF